MAIAPPYFVKNRPRKSGNLDYNRDRDRQKPNNLYIDFVDKGVTMLQKALSMQWLWDIAQDYRSILKQSEFYQKVALASCPEDFQWIRQLYYLSCDFTAAVAIRYGSCPDPRFRDAFGEHAAEEVTHPEDLAAWMREYGFLAADELPTSVHPTLETLALGSYFIRSVIREPIAHQIITINLMTEGIAFDFYNRINPKLAELGLIPKGYWSAHQEADMEHQVLGLDLIPYCEKNSELGQIYTRTMWEIYSLWVQEFSAWSQTMGRCSMVSPPVDLELN
jgi:Iron-containing redox enzyme